MEDTSQMATDEDDYDFASIKIYMKKNVQKN